MEPLEVPCLLHRVDIFCAAQPWYNLIGVGKVQAVLHAKSYIL